jgi:hypothetical protein
VLPGPTLQNLPRGLPALFAGDLHKLFSDPAMFMAGDKHFKRQDILP